MTIPIRNIYYLLLYAWGHFKASASAAMGADDGPDLPNLLAKVLNESTHRLLRQGLDRGYIGITEETRTPRGRIRLDVISKQQTLLRGLAVCDLDELTSDVLHNQILKTSLLALASCGDVAAEVRHDLRESARRMVNVSLVSLNSSLFTRVQLSRNTSQYSLLMRVCELVFHSLMPDQQGSGSKFKSLLEDEVRMSSLFEHFLRNFYRVELDGYSANAEIMPWSAETMDDAARLLLPVMKTDMTLRSSSRTIIVDAKYYKEALSKGPYGPKIRSSHLYQLSTYLAHAREKEPVKELAGILVYPANGEDLRLHYRLLGAAVTVATIDLSMEWTEIHNALLNIISSAEKESASSKETKMLA